MPREINNTQAFQDKVVKLIPTEIVGAYMVLVGAIPVGQEKIGTLIISGVLLLLTPLYLWKLSGVTNVLQMAATSFSFIVWVYSLGGPFQAWGVYSPGWASIALIIWTLAIPLIVSPKAQPAPAPAPNPGGS